MILTGIVAGGTGSRMGHTALPKQFWELAGKPVFVYTAEAFLASTDFVIIGMNPAYVEQARQLAEQFLPDKVFVIDGGADRNETVSRIIAFAREKLACQREDVILTHDAVRPFVTQQMIQDSLAAVRNCDICTAAVPATDTLAVSCDGSTADSFPDRSQMFLVQTPQTFRIGDFEEIYRSLDEEEKHLATDVCRLFQAKHKKVKLIAGSPDNIKLTYLHDYQIACLLAKNR